MFRVERDSGPSLCGEGSKVPVFSVVGASVCVEGSRVGSSVLEIIEGSVISVVGASVCVEGSRVDSTRL